MSLMHKEREKMIKDFQLNPQDTGSVEVQVALLTVDIKRLTAHLQDNNKDFSCKRGLMTKVSQRKSFLNYLKKKSEARYKLLVDRLGLKK